jgi:SusD family.
MIVPIQNTVSTSVLLLISLLFSCKKFVEVEPPRTRLVSHSVFENEGSANAAIIGIYSSIMSTTNGLLSGGITLYSGLSADEFTDYSNGSYGEFSSNSLTPSNGSNQTLWSEAYNRIYAANSIIIGLENSKSLPAESTNRFKSEAKFIRALCYFYLTNFYGDVPQVTDIDYELNTKVSRSSRQEIYNLIIKDLIDAERYLPDDYSINSGERTRPNKWSAKALLARAYLYTGDWANAERYSTEVINNNGLYQLLPNLNDVFLKNSSESILQFAPVRSETNTNEGEIFIITAAPDNVTLTSNLVNTFSNDDKRKNNWIDTFILANNKYIYPFKYKVKKSATVTEYYTVLRLAEQFLIRAEARAQNNDISGAIFDINIIRQRAGVEDLSTVISKSDCLDAILSERRLELFCEWGHRWLDLKRTNKADQIMKPLKGANWQSTDTLYPIPQIQISNDPNISQNPGY